jgi:hypothetical protein
MASEICQNVVKGREALDAASLAPSSSQQVEVKAAGLKNSLFRVAFRCLPEHFILSRH